MLYITSNIFCNKDSLCVSYFSPSAIHLRPDSTLTSGNTTVQFLKKNMQTKPIAFAREFTRAGGQFLNA